MDLGHGANVEDMAAKYGKQPQDILDFSANINPYRIDYLEKYILEAVNKSSSYPDIYYTKLKNNIAQYLGCPSAYVIPGNGATEIMYLLMKCIKGPLGIINPTFSEYERSARLSGIEVVSFYLHKENNFLIEIEELEQRIDEFECLFICNPNNPTGNVQNIKEVLDLLKSHNKFLIVDETFIEFIDDEAAYSLLSTIKTQANLIIIKAATKFFGLPGIRLGYGITSNKELLEQMYLNKEPWTINSFAEHLAGYIFKEAEYIRTTKTYFKEERQRVLHNLRAISSFKTYTTDANFILIELKEVTAHTLREKLFREHNLLIRDASNFKGLDEHFMRIAIRTKKENDMLLSLLRNENLFQIGGDANEKIINCRYK